MFRKITSLLLAAMLFTGLLSGCSSKEEPKELNIMSWAYYVPDEVIADFTAETGIKVNYTEFSTNEEMLSIFQAKTDQYDVIVCSDYIIDVMIKDGNLLGELDKAKIPNWKNIDPGFQSKYYDPNNKYTIPHAGAAAILCYDSAQVDFEVKGYEDLWNPAFENKVVLLDGDRDIIGMTLMTMGKSVNETDTAVLEEAKQKMMELKPNVIAFDADTPHNAIIRGDAVIGYMFGSQATAAMAEIDTVKYVYPEEGVSFYIDNYVMSKKAPHPENAYKFLNFILDGKNSAKISSLINYINTNTAAKEFLPEEFKNNGAVNIPSEIVGKSQMFIPVGDAAVEYDTIWTQFKAGR